MEFNRGRQRMRMRVGSKENEGYRNEKYYTVHTKDAKYYLEKKMLNMWMVWLISRYETQQRMCVALWIERKEA